MNREREAECLPRDDLQVKTHCFGYPEVGDLIDLLGSSLETRLVGFEGINNIGEVLKQAKLEYVDDFTFLSPHSLHIDSGIPVGAIHLLYRGAEEMIRALHLTMEQEIGEIEGTIEI